MTEKVNELIEDMQRSLEMITKWLKDSELIVNISKTKLCYFHILDIPEISKMINGNEKKIQLTFWGWYLIANYNGHIKCQNNIKNQKSIKYNKVNKTILYQQ